MNVWVTGHVCTVRKQRAKEGPVSTMAGGVAVQVWVTGHVACTVRERSEIIAGQLTFSLFFIHSRPSAFVRAVALSAQGGSPLLS